jgi:hypothetical protein
MECMKFHRSGSEKLFSSREGYTSPNEYTITCNAVTRFDFSAGYLFGLHLEDVREQKAQGNTACIAD